VLGGRSPIVLPFLVLLLFSSVFSISIGASVERSEAKRAERAEQPFGGGGGCFYSRDRERECVCGVASRAVARGI
jgi:hypothetical protein